MAIKALAWMVRVFEPPVYCYHEIVHNRIVVEEFERQGVIFVDDVTTVPPGAALMLSAHGSAPAVEAAAGEQGRVVVDACCPLVTKVHHEMKVRARKGYTVLYVGHENHEEAVGTMAVAPSSVRLVQHEDDVIAAAAAIPPHTPVALLAQTTLPHDEWAGLVDAARERFPDLWMPGRSDLCYATTNRQAAMRALAPGCDAVVVIGSANSSNTVSLVRVAEMAGCPRAIRVNAAAEIPDDLSGVVGVTAGASAPEWLVKEIIERLAPANGIELVHVTEEDEYFPPPPELRDLLRIVGAAASFALGAPANGAGATATSGSGDGGRAATGGAPSGPAGPAAKDDRAVSAADVLRPPVAAGAGLDSSA